MIFRVKYMQADDVPYIHLRVFSAEAEGRAWSPLGALAMRRDEFACFRMAFDAVFVVDEQYKAARKELPPARPVR